jgi:polyhydroxybutyrate depolymerase
MRHARVSSPVTPLIAAALCSFVVSCSDDGGADESAEPSAATDAQVQQDASAPTHDARVSSAPDSGQAAPRDAQAPAVVDAALDAGGIDAARPDTGVPGRDAQADTGSSVTPIASDGGLPMRTEGCGKPAQATPREGAMRSVDVMGASAPRTFILDIPAGYDPSKAYPLVFGFHGAGSSSSAFRGRGYGNLPGVAGAEAILVHPMALAGSSGTPAWNDASDVAFFDAILATLRAELCIDGKRIFATGHSSGGFMSNQLGCVRGNVLRGIAPIAGGGPRGRNCVGQIAAWIEHGDADPTVALSSGEGSRDVWARANHCDTTKPMPVEPSPCVTYAGCDQGFPVHWCVQPGQTHSPMASFSAPGAWNFFKSL